LPENDDRSERHPLDAWVLNTLPRAVRFAQSLLSNSSDADDLVHDCYCRLLQKSSRYDLARDGTKLLYRSITNACIDRARKGQRTVSLHGGDDKDPSNHMMIDHKSETPAAIVVQRELADAIGFALAQLPVDQRAALELKSMGYSLAEIADAVDVTESNAGVLVHRARRAVADHLKRTFGEESA
jgi:RNA polymerase sigma-70 factor (ECF subfamily)